MVETAVVNPGTVVSVWTATYWQVIIGLLYLGTLSALAVMISRRTPASGTWRQTSVPKIAVLLVMLDSYAYILTAALMTLTIGTSRTAVACNAGVWICVTLYAFTKIFICFFLVERIHIVHGGLQKRFRSRLYIFNLAVVSCWIGVFIMFLSVHESAGLRLSDNSCVYHLNHDALFVTAAVEIAGDVYFTLMFAIPLYRGSYGSPRIKRIALKSMIAAILSMTSSIANLLTNAALHGNQLSWVCLASCTLDTFVNCAVLYWTTQRDSPNASSEQNNGDETTSQDLAPSFRIPVNYNGPFNGPFKRQVNAAPRGGQQEQQHAPSIGSTTGGGQAVGQTASSPRSVQVIPSGTRHYTVDDVNEWEKDNLSEPSLDYGNRFREECFVQSNANATAGSTGTDGKVANEERPSSRCHTVMRMLRSGGSI